jgi:hypothetical protein
MGGVRRVALTTLGFVAAALGPSRTVQTQGAGEIPLLFETSAPSSSVGAERWVLRSRPVRIRFDLLEDDAANLVLDLNLFDDVLLRAVRDQVIGDPSGSRTWVGHVEGEEWSEVYLTSAHGVMFGSIRLLHKLFRVTFWGPGQYSIQEIGKAPFRM